MYRVLNISGGQLVCDLGGGGTLRLDDKEDMNIKDTDMTDHIQHLESLGYIKCTKVAEETPVVKSPAKNNKKED